MEQVYLEGKMLLNLRHKCIKFEIQEFQTYTLMTSNMLTIHIRVLCYLILAKFSLHERLFIVYNSLKIVCNILRNKILN